MVRRGRQAHKVWQEQQVKPVQPDLKVQRGHRDFQDLRDQLDFKAHRAYRECLVHLVLKAQPELESQVLLGTARQSSFLHLRTARL